jgi:hypothetical protein
MRAALVMSPILLGLAVMWRRVRQRPVSRAKPAFAEAAQGPLDGVAGAGADILSRSNIELCCLSWAYAAWRYSLIMPAAAIAGP